MTHRLRRNASSVFDPAHDRTQADDAREKSRLFYVGATRGYAGDAAVGDGRASGANALCWRRRTVPVHDHDRSLRLDSDQTPVMAARTQ